MTKTTKTTGTATATALEAAKVAATEAKLIAKYGDRIVKGSCRRADLSNADEACYGQKMLVNINTLGVDGSFDGNTRRVATSDVFQVKHTATATATLRKARLADKRKAKAAVATAAPAKGKAKAKSALAVLDVE